MLVAQGAGYEQGGEGEEEEEVEGAREAGGGWRGRCCWIAWRKARVSVRVAERTASQVVQCARVSRVGLPLERTGACQMMARGLEVSIFAVAVGALLVAVGCGRAKT